MRNIHFKTIGFRELQNYVCGKSADDLANSW